MKMQPDKKIKSDLEYLSEQGYESFPGAEKDIVDLKAKLSTKHGHASSSPLFIAFTIGLFLSITVFFTIYNSPTIFPSRSETIKHQNDLFALKSIQIDTVELIAKKNATKLSPPEKFIEPTELDSSLIFGKAEDLLTVSEINSITDTTSVFNELEIKYAPNAPYIYLHDLKIANYNLYYFKSQKSVTVHGSLNADKANKNETGLKIEDSYQAYFLHEVIKEAMKQFKKQNYKQCLTLLERVSEFSKNDINCYFYLGMCYYYLNDYPNSYKELKQAQIHTCNVFYEETNYYLALGAQKTNRLLEAEQLLTDIANNNGFYTKKAKELLSK